MTGKYFNESIYENIAIILNEFDSNITIYTDGNAKLYSGKNRMSLIG